MLSRLRHLLLLTVLLPSAICAAPPTHLGSISHVIQQRDMLLSISGADEFITIRQPAAIAAWGNLLYLYDNARQLLYRYEQSSERLYVMHGTIQQLQGIPNALAVAPDGSIFISDPAGLQVVQFDIHGQLLRRYQNPLNLTMPVAIAFSTYGNTLIADSAYNHVLVFDPSGQALRAIGRRGSAPGEVMHLVDIASGPDLVYLLDRMPCKVVLFNENGELLHEQLCREVRDPNHLAVDNYGRIYISDGFDDTIKVYHRHGLLDSFGGSGSNNGQFRMISDLEISDELLYVADSANDRIQQFLLSNPLYPERSD